MKILLRSRFPGIADSLADYIDTVICKNVQPFCPICFKNFAYHVVNLMHDEETVYTNVFKNYMYGYFERLLRKWDNRCYFAGKEKCKSNFDVLAYVILVDLFDSLDEPCNEQQRKGWETASDDIRDNFSSCDGYRPPGWIYHCIKLGSLPPLAKYESKTKEE